MLLLKTDVDADCIICCEQPKTENVCGLPNISCSYGSWDFFADAFAWYTSEEASAVWANIINFNFINNTSSFTAQDLTFNWDFGFRVGAGHNLEYDGWDTQLYWTWFRTETEQSQHVPTSDSVLVIAEIMPEFFAGDLSSNSAQSAKIRWSIRFNMFDWELGRSYWISKGLLLRPFIGLKGGWIHQSIHVQYGNLIIANAHTNNSARENAKNNFWGLGPVGGLNTKWKLRNFCTHFPSLFGDFSVATMWGNWTCNDVYNDTTGKEVLVNTKKLTLGALMLRGFAGFGWDVDFDRGRSHFATRLGYEMQLWVNQLRLSTAQLVPLHGDLTLQGITLNCRFDF